MRVDVINVCGRHGRSVAGQPHRAQRRIASRVRLSEMVPVNGGAIANDFAQDDCATTAGARSNVSSATIAAPSPSAKPSRRASNGRQPVGESACSESKPEKTKLAQRVIPAGQNALGLAASE